MKILFISSNEPDYQNDVTLHGLKSLFGDSVVDIPKKPCMYTNEHDTQPIYGNGFTIFKTLQSDRADRTDISNKIKGKFFDAIVYGSARRNLQFVNEAFAAYDKSKIAFIDGEDDTYIGFNLADRGVYFKRELGNTTEGVYPISFGFPAEKIPAIFMEKTKLISDTVPGIDPWNRSSNGKKNYAFTKEEDYYAEYQKSKFAWTWKKAGWDCMRHYEIIFNRCLPLFFELQKMPTQTMEKFPREKIEAYQDKWFEKLTEGYDKSLRIKCDIDKNEYDDVVESIFEYSKNNLTTINTAKSVLNLLKL
jgi:hypothetical protein